MKQKLTKKYVDSTFVTLATKQTITGEKTFSSVLNTAAIKASGTITAPSLAVSDWVTIAGIKLRKLEDGALMLEGNLALTGALTMYASNGQSFDTIYDGLPIDNDTIYWQEVDGSRFLKAREGSGSSFDKSAMWTALAGSTTEQINKSHLTTALTGYATESWVSGKNYAVKATTLAGYGITDAYTKKESDGKYPTKTGSGASGTWGIGITGNAATASKWATARTITLGSYLSGSVSLDGSANVTLNANVVGLTSQGNKTAATGNTSPASGVRLYQVYNNGYPTPYGNLLSVKGGGAGELLLSWANANRIYYRSLRDNGDNWLGWNELAFITDNVASATKLQTARTLWGQSFNGTKNVSGDLNYVGNINFTLKGRLVSNSSLELSCKNDDTTSLTFTGTVFRPFTSAHNNIDLGASTVRWRDLYIGRNAYVDGITKTGDFYIGGIRLHKTADGVITLEGNLAVTGGITTYAIDPVSASTIMDGVVVDGVTIKKENGKLVAVGGGEAGSVAWENISGKPSVFATNIANITDLHSSWDSVLAAQKPAWLTAVSIATISDLHANWDALLKAAPSAYVTRWPTISEVTGKQNLIVKLNGGTTEGTNQFTYNATGAKTINITPAGIGAAASSHNHSWSNITSGKPTTLAGYGITDGVNSVSFAGSGNAITSASISGHKLTLTKGNTFVLLKERNINTTYKGLWDIDKTNGGANCWNNPANAALQLQNNNNALAIIIDGNENGRMANIQVGHENTNYAANVGVLYLNRLGGDVYIGTTLAATINSNVASATKLQNTRYLWGVAFDGTKNIEGTLTIYSDNTFDVGTDACNFNNIYARVVRNTKARDMVITQDASAGLLFRTSATNRIYITSNGYVGINKNDPSFTLDVSGYIRADLAHLGAIETNTYGTGKWTDTNMLSNATIKSVAYGAVAISSAHCHIGWKDVISGVGYSTYYAIGSARENSNWGSLYFAVGNNDAGTSAGCKLYLRGYGQAELIGNLLVTGGTTFYESDQRAKNIIGLVYLSLMQISEAPTIRFRWNGWHTKDDGRNHVGGIAQYIQGILPEAIINSDKSLSMDYATVAYTFAVHTARHLMSYETRTDKKIKKLENRVKYLEKQLKKLGYEEVRTLDDSGI